MGRFAPLLPEIILAIGGLVLMMVAAFTGPRRATLVGWLAVALLIAATVALVGAPSHAGPLFDGMVAADLFASFGKAVIFPAAAAAIIAGHGWFERSTDHAAEYSVLIVFAAVGMAVMVSATSLVSLYVGLELNSLAGYVLASYLRTDERSAAEHRRSACCSASCFCSPGSHSRSAPCRSTGGRPMFTRALRRR
jgi:NADH-quinone oxidoreductase subunit N